MEMWSWLLGMVVGGLVVGLGGPFQPSRFYEWAWVVLAQVPEMIPGKTGPHLGIAH